MPGHRIIKGIAGTSLILGAAVLLVSIWSFGSIVYRENTKPAESRNVEKISKNRGRDDSRMLPDKLTANTSSTKEENNSLEFWAEFEYMPDIFKGMVIGCAWIAIIGGVLQIASCLFIIFSSAKNVLNRSKYLVAVHFLSFLILLATFFTPVAYDRINENFYTMTSFNTKVKNGFQKLEEEGFIKFIWSDLHAYYIVLFIDCMFLFFIMIILSCLLRLYYTPKLDFDDGRYAFND